jgi:uracil-DNA glycosylase
MTDTLLREIEAEARRAEFPVDVECCARCGRDPHVPILYAGSLTANVCSFGRELGRDEVRYAQPLVGAAGKKVRRGIIQALGIPAPAADPRLECTLEHVLLSNMVPYKPPGNKAYSAAVKERFRPYVAQLLACYWRGPAVITLGTEAFQWFAPYAEPGAAEEFWRRPDRYEAEFPCVIRAACGDVPVERAVTVCPLPHPSPLNRRWQEAFPRLLEARLAKWLRSSSPAAVSNLTPKKDTERQLRQA